MEEETIQQTVEKIDLFSFYRAFFSTDGIWETLTDKAKMDHAFMLHRLLAIKHPEYMSAINTVRSIYVLNALHEEFKSKGKQPGWAYTKSTKEETPIIESLKKYPDILINNFLNAHGLERKSFMFLLEYDSASVFKQLDNEMKVYNQSTTKKTKK